MRRSVLLCALVALVLRPAAAWADIWSYTDSEGVVHFTNIPPKGKGKKWKKVQVAPGKAAQKRGRCKGCDVVPSSDSTSERYSRYDDHIREAAELYIIPEALIRAVIKVESDYDPKVVSRVGARGLMQLMPAAQKDMRVDEVHEPRANILGGTRLLRVLANKFDGDIVLTIAAYHAGAGSVRKYGNTIPPYENTQKYVKMVLKQYYKYKAK